MHQGVPGSTRDLSSAGLRVRRETPGWRWETPGRVRGARILAGALALFAAGNAGAQDAPGAGNAEAGRKVAGMCRTCHGLDGVAQIPVAPNIGGEPAAYLAEQLHAFREGERVHEMMSVVAAGLSDGQIADVAAWYAAHRATAALPEGVAEGDAPELCVDCHGADGIAVVEGVPNLAGEPAIYVEAQLKAFRSGRRENPVMTPIAESLAEEDLRRLAEWYGATELTVTPPE